MTEISDLQPEQPAGELLTPGQVALYVKQHRAERPCEACGSQDWTMWPDAKAPAGFVVLDCDQCHCIRSFLRPPIVAWVRSNRA